MKAWEIVKKYLAQTVFVAIWLAFLPVAVVMLSSLWLIDSLVIPTLDIEVTENE